MKDKKIKVINITKTIKLNLINKLRLTIINIRVRKMLNFMINKEFKKKIEIKAIKLLRDKDLKRT